MHQSVNFIKRLGTTVLAILLCLPLLVACDVPVEKSEAVIYADALAEPSNILASENFESRAVGENTLPAGDFQQVPPSHFIVSEDGNQFLRIPITGNYVSRAVSPTGNEICEGNVDKSLIMKNPGFSEGLVVTSVDYRWNVPAGSENANVKVQSQIKGTRTSGAANNWSALYAIFSNGKLSTPSETGKLVEEVSDRVLKAGVWYNFKTILDPVNGTYCLFIDNELWVEDNVLANTAVVASGYTAADYRNAVYNANSFIVAKVNKGLDYNAGITYDVDNIIMYEATDRKVTCTVDGKSVTADEGSILTVPRQNAAGEGLIYCDVTVNGRVAHVPGTQFVATEGMTVTPYYLGQSVFDGLFLSPTVVSLRAASPAGLRYVTEIDPAKLDSLQYMKEEGYIQSYTVGTLVAPTDYIDDQFTKAVLDKAGNDVNYVTVTARSEHIVTDKNGKTTFSGALIGIQTDHRGMSFSGVGFAECKLSSGKTVTAYAPYDPAKASASAAQLAKAALANSKQSFTEEEVNNMKAFTEKREDQNLTGGKIDSVSAMSNAVYFRVKGTQDFYCRLVYTGATGWRLQAQTDGFNSFRELGAAQGFSAALGEQPVLTVKTLTRETLDGNKRLSVVSPDGGFVELDSEMGTVSVFSPASDLLMKITGFKTVGNSIRMSGELLTNEAVFGLGERFDTVNKSRTHNVIYTVNGWNKSNATYMVVPFFTTSRGGGLFVNNFNYMVMDFGCEKNSVWYVDLDDTLFDCYLYDTGKISDAIFGYTELTGHASMPEDWYQGPVICRYAPDLNRLKGYSVSDRADGVFLGYGVVDTVKEFYKMGSMPTAMILEGWDPNVYSSSGYTIQIADRDKDGNLQYLNAEKTDIKTKTVTATSAMKQQAMKDVTDYLHNLNIKVMLWMRAGGVLCSSTAPGYKQEYLVHADILADGKIQKANTVDIPDLAFSSADNDPDVGAGASGFQYLDITNPDAWNWYINTIWGKLTELGIDGMKIDYCEFMPDDDYTYNSNLKLQYHWYDPSVFENVGVHHGYIGLFITKLYDTLNAKLEDGFMVLSRGGGFASQRNPYLWAGDQTRDWDKLDDQLMAMINSGLSGVPFMTYDMSGYQYSSRSDVQVGVYNRSTGEIKVGVMNPGTNEVKLLRRGPGKFDVAGEAKIFLRGVEFTALSPCVQSHGFVQNAYDFDAETQKTYTLYMKLHGELQAYIDKYCKIAVDTGMPVTRHLVLQYQDDIEVYGINNEYLLGEGLLVAPILTDTTSRKVYLPEGEWINLLTGEKVSGGKTVSVTASIGQIPVFLNTAAADAKELQTIFSGATWTAIKGGTALKFN